MSRIEKVEDARNIRKSLKRVAMKAWQIADDLIPKNDKSLKARIKRIIIHDRITIAHNRVFYKLRSR